MSVLPVLKVVILGDSGVGKTCLRSQFVNHIFSNAYKATIGSDYLTTTVEIPQKQSQLHSLQLQNDPHQPNSTHSDSIQSHTQNIAVDSHQRGPKLGSLPDKLKKVSKLQNSSSTLKDSSLLLEQETTIPHNRNDTSPSLLGNTLTKVNLQIWDTSGQERFNSISQAFYRGADVVVLVYDITNYESVLSLRDWFARFMNHCHVDKPGVIIVGNKIDKANERVVDMEEIRHIITSNTDINVNDYIDNWEEDLVEVNAKSSPLVEKLFTRVAVIGVGLSNSKTAVQYLNTLDLSQTTRTSYCAC